MRENNIHKRLLSVMLVCSMLLTGCTGPGQDKDEIKKDFDEYTDNLFLEDISQNTIDLHYTLAYPENYGIEDYEVTLGELSMEDMEDTEKELKELKEELLKYDRSALTESQKLTYDLLMDYVDTELDAVDLVYYWEPLSPMGGYQAQLPILLAEYTFRRERDVEDYLVLLTQVDDMFEDIIAYEEKKADEGFFMADFALEGVIEQCEEFIAEPEENYLIQVFDDKIDALEGISEEDKEAYKEKNRELVTGEVVDSYRMLADALEELEGRGENDLGLCYYEDGTEYYEYLVLTETGSDAGVEELKERTEKFLENREEEVYTLVMENPDLLDVFTDPDAYGFPYTDPEEIMEDLIEKCSRDFPEPPQVDYTIKYVHPSLEEHLNPAFYLTPPIDDIKNNVIYINEKYMDEDIYTTLAHEGYPGHLYQEVSTASHGLSLVRNLLSYPGYTEGWATYTEMYSYNISGLDRDAARLLACDNIYSLGISAYIDMGVNYDGWDVSDVEEYLAGFGIEDEETARDIFEAVVEEPAEYLRYFIGYLEFNGLKNRAKDQLGEDFELKEFHEFIIEIGPAPFYIIRERMEQWIKEKKEDIQ